MPTHWFLQNWNCFLTTKYIFKYLEKSKMSETNIKTHYMDDNNKLSQLLKRNLKKLEY